MLERSSLFIYLFIYCNCHYSVFNCVSGGMETVTVTGVYLFSVCLFLNSKLFLELFVCANVPMPLFSWKG